MMRIETDLKHAPHSRLEDLLARCWLKLGLIVLPLYGLLFILYLALSSSR